MYCQTSSCRSWHYWQFASKRRADSSARSALARHFACGSRARPSVLLPASAHASSTHARRRCEAGSPTSRTTQEQQCPSREASDGQTRCARVCHVCATTPHDAHRGKSDEIRQCAKRRCRRTRGKDDVRGRQVRVAPSFPGSLGAEAAWTDSVALWADRLFPNSLCSASAERLPATWGRPPKKPSQAKHARPRTPTPACHTYETQHGEASLLHLSFFAPSSHHHSSKVDQSLIYR